MFFLGSSVCRHSYAPMRCATKVRSDFRRVCVRTLLEGTLKFSPIRSQLSNREWNVCLDILIGCSTEALSLRHGLSRESAKIYRSRIYERLGIGTKDELYQLVISHLCKVGGETQKPHDAASETRLKEDLSAVRAYEFESERFVRTIGNCMTCETYKNREGSSR